MPTIRDHLQPNPRAGMEEPGENLKAAYTTVELTLRCRGYRISSDHPRLRRLPASYESSLVLKCGQDRDRRKTKHARDPQGDHALVRGDRCQPVALQTTY
ncbi:hypothetical protein PLICRDRAFT_578486 [Plicaturopsis crispa FD-325 SS-3]|nr:hypothetical protein PLICRDRAFT_578486 [Plicaturopsis crispa FD-325 SS-3]